MSILAGDPLTQLALSVYENKGVYALLVGSGLSRAPEIPTGWEITIDLVRRVAAAQGIEDQPDWAAWYKEKTGKEPNYSELVGELGLSRDERRSILHSYIEPDDEDREEGRKLPTKAHHAIASLVREGYVRTSGNRQHSTCCDHMPPNHRFRADWTPEQIRRQAARIGPNAEAFVEVVMRERKYPEQGFRTCLGVIRLAKTFGRERLEAACERALLINARSYSSLHSILKNGLDQAAPGLPAIPKRRFPQRLHPKARGLHLLRFFNAGHSTDTKPNRLA